MHNKIVCAAILLLVYPTPFLLNITFHIHFLYTSFYCHAQLLRFPVKLVLLEKVDFAKVVQTCS